MDEAPLRRNKPTIHTLHGLNVGILSGDGLMLKAYKFFEDLEPEIFKACIRIFTHNFTLIHDDIMDEAPLRRNKPTIHTLHGLNVG
ncbi:hypothetical protein BOQ60_24580, partial [Chryseobacterium sp. CH1]